MLVERTNAKDEANAAAAWLLEQRRAGRAWRDCAVAAPGKRNWRAPIAAALDRAGIPCRMMLGDPSTRCERDADVVHVMTLHAIAGSTFAAIAMLGIGDLPWKRQTLDEATTVVDAAMACAGDALLLSCSKPSALAERLRERADAGG